MKKKIYQLAREEFEYSSAELLLKEDWIKKEVEEGKQIKGTLFIRNSDNRRMKGVLYATAPFIQLKATSFSGTEALVDYELCSMGRRAGEKLTGEIYLVTSCGEYSIGVELLLQEKEEKKKAGNLFRLANQARSDWPLAVEQYKSLYTKRRGHGPASQELEEFLIDGNKKSRVEVHTDATSFYYEPVTETFAESLVLKKSSWGYLKLQVWSDVEFLQPEHKVIWSDNFIGEEYILEFLVRKEKLHAGKNYGRLYIKTVHQLLTVEVCAVCQGEAVKKHLARKRKEALLLLLHMYFQYRSGLLEQEAYGREGLAWRKEYQTVLTEAENQLLEAYFMILDGQEALATELLKDVHPEGSLEHAAILYLEQLSSQEEKEREERYVKLWELYQGEPENLSLLWFVLQLGKGPLAEPEKRVALIEEYNRKHCPSTILHIELLEVLNEKPSILKQLTPQRIKSLNWGIRMNLLSDKVQERYVFLAANEEAVGLKPLSGLKELYRHTASEEILSAILNLMVKNNCIGSKYFRWYEKGITRKLRVRNLFESYLCSAEDRPGLTLPRPVLTYFSYDNELPDAAKELLYAYILRNREKDMDTYLAYAGRIEEFALKRLLEGALNRLLAELYMEILKPGLEERYLRQLAELLFQQELICENPNMVGVYIAHKELEGEEYFPLEKGRARVYLFTENPQISFADENGCRYGSSIEYRTEAYLELSDWQKECYRVVPEHPRLLLNYYEKIEKYQKFDENAMEVRQRVQRLPGLRREYKTECSLVLIRQYFDRMEEQPLRELLLSFSPELVPEEKRAELIDYCILQELYERAYALMKIWGYRKVPISRLLRFACKWLETVSGKEEPLLSLCQYLLQCGRYTSATLTYLVLFGEGLLEQLVVIWEKAKATGVEAWPLEERLLTQLLFTEGYVRESFRIFASYYPKKKDTVLIRAYLNYYSYCYFVKGVQLPEEFFHLLPGELEKEYSKTMALAYLQEKSEKEELSQKEKQQVEQRLYDFLNKNEIFAFFKAFKGKLSMEEGLFNRTFVEYRTAPGQRLSISYRLGDMDGFKTVPMPELGYGIYTTDFLVFPDEVLQYYITEYGQEEQITESRSITENDESRELEDSDFGLLGAILAARQLKDDAATEQLMEEYILQSYQKETLFPIL